MHRTTTTATLLVTVAATALTGCVTVQRPPASSRPPAPALPSAPRPDGNAEPQVVQAPAREALALIEPSRKPSPSTSKPSHAAPPAPAAPQAPPQRRPHTTPQPQPDRPAPRTVTPPATPELPKTPDLCALGRKYGGWKADSPESVICKETYGH
ncbi:hypothetical protein AB0D57_26850 [Streptomyces sp. NPDC048275]|uniref:hypothetical protein n=1 Tax=Streptomyces sp. NPDC048275 TaxID=3155629 RepID=UPI00340E8F93